MGPSFYVENTYLKLIEDMKISILSRMLYEALLQEGNDIEGKCADVLVENKKGQFLLLKRPDDDDLFPGKWCCPGGHRQDDETIQQGAERECFEESGIKVKGIEKLFNWTYPNGFKTTFFLAREGIHFNDPTVTLSDEHVAYKWLMGSEIEDNVDLAGDLLEPLLKAIDSVQ